MTSSAAPSGLLLGIDIGTSSAKGVLARPDGTLLASAQREHTTSSPRPGWFEHDAEDIWWADLRALARELLAQLPAGERLAGVGVSGIGPCLLPADAAGAPVRPAILYGVDTRAGAQIAAQNAHYGAEEIIRRCGAPLTSQAVGPKFAWLREREPAAWARTRRWFMASSYLTHRLTGAYVLDHHSASQSVPLYDPRAGAWIPEWCEEIAPGLEWPRLVWPAETVGEVTPEAEAATGIPAGTPVVAGIVDAWAEATAAGVRDPGDVMLMYGTTMFLVNVVGEPVGDARLWGTAGAFPGTHCLAAGMATSGAVTGWLRELTGASYPELTEEADRLPPGAEGLLMLPYFAGERTPLFDPDARGLIHGLTLRHGRGHLYRAALEATAFGVRHNLETMVEAGGSPERLVAVGGGARGLWTRIVSDVTGRPQQVPRHTIGAAHGDALFAALGTGLVSAADLGGWNPVASVVEPDPATGEVYEELYGLYRELYPATREAAHVLAARQHKDA
ncbi:FGGY-family carbohydrate kinase [Streptomyces physcomitrii]|uniref:FGGY-family carbohydrate kinase n=1 Tax=Streptomyces physcomitrii TaxID=2724184 RepID=A0ABX1H5T0_9ACTN|nr:FGGY-family carbohydrate kinase [Streptomyces physcomitrii]NKI43433.1 FGGY-family carbohydrate kinase [Streptomyces physcomitrii]